jgi:hypothetical protein
MIVPSAEEVHDLAITEIKGLPLVLINGRTRRQAPGLVLITIQNRSPHVEVIPDLATLSQLITLQVKSLGGCPDIAPELVGDPVSRSPVELMPKQSFKVSFRVQLQDLCINDPEQSVAGGNDHDDYQYLAQLHHEALDGKPDSHPVDDVCPRSVAPPFEIDPNPDGSIVDRGCGALNPDGTRGGDVTTDVVEGGNSGRPVTRGPRR